LNLFEGLLGFDLGIKERFGLSKKIENI